MGDPMGQLIEMGNTRAAIIDEIERRGKIMREALRAIARGSPIKGMPLARYESQRVAREALTAVEEGW